MIESASVLYREDREDPDNATLMIHGDGKTHEYTLSRKTIFSLLESIAETLRRMEARQADLADLVCHLHPMAERAPIKHPQELKWRQEAKKVSGHQS